ncbi:MAG TPA: hypothetical protein HPQ00_09230 [Magnetococcales bacterium]|nr:hypothetical protein [Magnetococcales bacterium]
MIVLAGFEGKPSEYQLGEPFPAGEESRVVDFLTMLDNVSGIVHKRAVAGAGSHSPRPQIAQIMVATGRVNG